MNLTLSHWSALRFYRSPKADNFCAQRELVEPPAGSPHLSFDEALWLHDRFGIGLPVICCVPNQNDKRRPKTVDCRLHCSGIDFRHYLNVGKRLYCSDPILTLAQVAAEMTGGRFGTGPGFPQKGWQSEELRSWAPEIVLAILICEFCGNYTLDPTRKEGYRQRLPLTDIAAIEALLSHSGRFAGKKLLERALALADEGSNSPAETSLRMIAAAPKKLGGRGLSLRFNQQICDVAAGDARNRYGDLCNLDRKLVIEYRSKERHEHRGQEDDARANELVRAGFTMLTVGPEELLN